MSNSENFVGHTCVQEVFDIVWLGKLNDKVKFLNKTLESSYEFRLVKGEIIRSNTNGCNFFVWTSDKINCV